VGADVGKGVAELAFWFLSICAIVPCQLNQVLQAVLEARNGFLALPPTSVGWWGGE